MTKTPRIPRQSRKQPGTTNDHTVPQMYLRRFAVPRGDGHQIGTAKADDFAQAFKPNVRNIGAEQGFYWGTSADGTPHHDMEKFLTEIEGLGATAFRQVLDNGKLPRDDAFPRHWPPRPATRFDISWWLAAQLLRTSRQRLRLRALEGGEGLETPSGLSASNLHLDFIAKMVAPVAKVLFERPWGIGFSDACLLTSDTPVLVLNGQDDSNQLDAIEYWDVFVPLDPHRCLFLPGKGLLRRLGISGDHKLKLHQGLGRALNQAVADTAVRHIFFHPDHDLRDQLDPSSRLPLPGNGADPAAPLYLVGSYELLPQDAGVERKWLTAHAPIDAVHATSKLLIDDEAVKMAELLMAELDEDHAGFNARARATED
ncbi:DUF4238 domain-containing protein [Homoserinimonas sp. A447]